MLSTGKSAMRIITDYRIINEESRGAVLAIGNFDGVHRGHRRIIDVARDIAARTGVKCAALTFAPHPRTLFRPDDPPFCIAPPPLKEKLLESCGVDCLFSLHFDWDFASQSAEEFIQNVLRCGIKPSHIVVGSDFAFGQLRKGTPETLKQAGFAVTILDDAGDEEGARYSSSAVRAALRHGKIAKANGILGWEWEIEGIIVKGDQRGRTLGFPTANVHLGQTIHPAYGVYASFVMIEGESIWRPAATNIGIRPMFEVPTGQIEAHILDFSGDIYDKILRVKPVTRLRGEAKFNSLESLVTQIEKDCSDVRAVLSGQSRVPSYP